MFHTKFNSFLESFKHKSLDTDQLQIMRNAIQITDLDSDITKYNDEVDGKCPRCGEDVDGCECDYDPWSTVNYFRLPKGEIIKSPQKQNFKQE